MEISKLITGIGQYDKAKVEKNHADSSERRSKSSAASSTGDKVTLSPEARLGAETYRAASEAPEIRQELVDSIKARIEAGEYEIDSKKIAANLIRDDLETLF